MTQRKVWWSEFPASAYSAVDPERTLAVLPLAAVEQHGPHLATGTDTAIMEGMLETVATLLPEDLDVRFLPIQAVGKSNEHVAVPGTLTISAQVAIAAWTEIAESVAETGIRKLVLLTSHGGNEEVMGILARDLRVRFAMMVVRSSWQRFGLPEGLFAEMEMRHGVHGGDYETSLMLHLRPDLVDMALARNFVSSAARAEEAFELLRPTGPHGFSWSASDLNPEGVVGNAAAATAEKGRLAAAHQAGGFVRLLREIAGARLADWIT